VLNKLYSFLSVFNFKHTFNYGIRYGDRCFLVVTSAETKLWFAFAHCVFSPFQGSHASWKALDSLIENSRIWKVLLNHFGPQSWKL